MERGNHEPALDGRYMRDIKRVPLLSHEEEIAFAKRIAAGGVDAEVAKRKLVEANLRLVVKIAKTYAGCGVSMMDLIQDGNLGLIRAAEKFDVSRGFKFSTYASYWVMHHILRCIRNSLRAIRLPAYVIDKLNLAQKLMRNGDVSLAEAAAEIGVEVSVLEEWLEENAPPLSLEWTGCDSEMIPLQNTVSDSDSRSSEEVVAVSELIREMIDCLGEFEERDKNILRMRFGIGYPDSSTLKEVGDEHGVTKERIRQIEAKRLKDLRAMLFPDDGERSSSLI